jgi:hypothetical protein
MTGCSSCLFLFVAFQEFCLGSSEYRDHVSGVRGYLQQSPALALHVTTPADQLKPFMVCRPEDSQVCDTLPLSGVWAGVFRALSLVLGHYSPFLSQGWSGTRVE